MKVWLDAGLTKPFCEKSYEDIYIKTRELEMYMGISAQKKGKRIGIKKRVEDLKKQL